MVDCLDRARALPSLRPLTTGAVACGLLVAATLGLQMHEARAQAGAPASKTATSRPLWATLNAEQQAALQPLAPHWDAISEPHKRKWLALSRNFASMKPEDQATLHSRMTDWAALSASQRAQARLNFAEVKRLPADERQAKWKAYQALSEEEKQKLADTARSARPASAAVPTRPVPARKLAPVPTLPATLARGEHTPRIQLTPPATPTAAAPAVPAPIPAVPPPPASPPPATIAAPPVPAESQVPAPGANSN